LDHLFIFNISPWVHRYILILHLHLTDSWYISISSKSYHGYTGLWHFLDSCDLICLTDSWHLVNFSNSYHISLTLSRFSNSHHGSVGSRSFLHILSILCCSHHLHDVLILSHFLIFLSNRFLVLSYFQDLTVGPYVHAHFFTYSWFSTMLTISAMSWYLVIFQDLCPTDSW